MDLKPFQQGYFDYNECFLSKGGFLAPEANEEKHMMGHYMQVLVTELANRHIIFGNNRPIHWLEPGIGDGSSTAGFLKSLAAIHKEGFIIHGSDYQESSVQLARIALEKLRSLNISIAEMHVRDAFSGEALSTIACDFALLSHFVYHIKTPLKGRFPTSEQIDATFEKLIKTVTDSITKDGIALAFHESPSSDMFGKIGTKYGSAMNDATDRIAKSAEANGKTIIRIPLESKLYFPLLPLNTLADFKNLEHWKHYPDATPEASWLKKFLFALHNIPYSTAEGETIKEGGAIDLAKIPGTLGNATQLGDAIDYVHALLIPGEGGCPHITIRSEMQAILNNPELKNPVKAAFSAVERCLPEIRQKTQEAIKRASSVDI